MRSNYWDELRDELAGIYLDIIDGNISIEEGKAKLKRDPLRYARVGNPEQPIPTHLMLPSYTERDFSEPQTVWIAKGYKVGKEGWVKEAVYNDSDRIVQWYGFDKHSIASKSVDKALPAWSPKAIEQYLRAVTDNAALELVHIKSAWQAYSMMPYQTYGFIEHKGEVSSNA